MRRGRKYFVQHRPGILIDAKWIKGRCWIRIEQGIAQGRVVGDSAETLATLRRYPQRRELTGSVLDQPAWV